MAVGLDRLAQLGRQVLGAQRGGAGFGFVAAADETAIGLAHRKIKAARRHAGADQEGRLQRLGLADAILDGEIFAREIDPGLASTAA